MYFSLRLGGGVEICGAAHDYRYLSTIFPCTCHGSRMEGMTSQVSSSHVLLCECFHDDSGISEAMRSHNIDDMAHVRYVSLEGAGA